MNTANQQKVKPNFFLSAQTSSSGQQSRHPAARLWSSAVRAVVLGKQPEILLLALSKNWASHSAPKACAKEAKEVYNAEDLKYTTPAAFQTEKKKKQNQTQP